MIKMLYGPLATAVLLSSAASATVHTYSVTGTVQSAAAQFNSAAGSSFTATFYYDDASPLISANPNSARYATGGGDVSAEFEGGSVSTIPISDPLLATYASIFVANSPSLDAFVLTQQSYGVSSLGFGADIIRLTLQDASHNVFSTTELPAKLDLADFDLATLTVSLNGVGDLVGTITALNEVNAVPEPTMWALMVGGFGMLGAAARRRRATFA